MMFNPDGTVSPLLAESYEHPDALTYIYKLRTGIKFHDGSEMTMDDVLASIARVTDAEVSGPLGWMYDPVDKSETPYATTLKITLKTASALFQFVPATT